MDKYDRMLLSALLENGRASYADLARKVNPVSYTHLTLPTIYSV